MFDHIFSATNVTAGSDVLLNNTATLAFGTGGSLDGDAPAAMRYTEARMTPIAEELLQDLDKDTVDFQPNFDESLKEPKVLPSMLPNLLVNGSSGIAVGMATNIPPHNLKEVCSAISSLIDNPEIEIKDIIQIIRGPDFPTGGIIIGRQGIVETYTTGRGSITLRAKMQLEEREREDFLRRKRIKAILESKKA